MNKVLQKFTSEPPGRISQCYYLATAANAALAKWAGRVGKPRRRVTCEPKPLDGRSVRRNLGEGGSFSEDCWRRFIPKKTAPYVLIISGPTASGKTDLSDQLSQIFPIEIINADMGQFYKPLSIGTAKPDWQSKTVKHHLFDIIDEPRDLNVFEFKKLILKKINEIWQEGKLPVVVGGSLFYLKSLYFPTKKSPALNLSNLDQEENLDENLWELLNKIDPERAKKLHPNDRYRIKRALQIWKKTGIKPSECKPEFNPEFNSLFVFICPEKKELDKRINQRTIQMIEKDGWIGEAENLINTKWEDFLKSKGLIGYAEIFEWIKNGKKQNLIPDLINVIQLKTRQYAKRQITFWKSFKQLLLKNSSQDKFLCEFLEENNSNDKVLLDIKNYLNKRLNFE